MADNEKLKLAGYLELNDETNFTSESLTFKPAEKKPQFVSNADADGEVLVEEAHYSNSTFEIDLRAAEGKTADKGREKLGELIRVTQEADRVEGGIALEWTPTESATTWTFYVLLAEINDIPITPTGDDAGWFMKMPKAKIKLTCRPFGYKEERQVQAAVESGAEPIQTLYVSGIGGDVPAEARIVATDRASKDRRFAEWGSDVVTSEVNPTLLFKGVTELKTEGYGGTSSTKTGSYSTNVVKGTLTPTLTAICGTGQIKHTGSYRAKLRCQVSGEGVLIHLSYRLGEGQWISSLQSASMTQVNQWMELNLGELFLVESERGEQVSEIRIEAKVRGANQSIYIDYLNLMPTRRYGIASAPANFIDPVNILLHDEFNQTPGVLNEQVISVAGSVAGPSNPETVVDDASIGKATWANPGNAKTSDDLRANAVLIGEEWPIGPEGPEWQETKPISHYLKATKFGFAIPVGSTINGIQATVEKKAAYNESWDWVIDAGVNLVKAGVVTGSNHASGARWGTIDGVVTYGSSSDLWGTTWTPAQINAEGFGVAIAAQIQLYGLEGNNEAFVDAFTITIYYTDATGQKWSTTGDAVDLSVEAGHTVQRTEVSDANIVTGRYAVAGTTEYTSCLVGITASRVQPTVAAGEKIRCGAIARYSSVENWLFGGFELDATTTNVKDYLVLVKRVTGTETELARIGIAPESGYRSVWMAVDANGRIFLWYCAEGISVPELMLVAEDSVFATGGARAKGKVGFYDVKLGANASTRHYDNFVTWIPELSLICASGQTLEITSTSVERSSSKGAYLSTIPQYRGSYLFLDPEGVQRKKNRLVLKMRRNNNTEEPDSTVTDRQRVEVFASERFLIPH